MTKIADFAEFIIRGSWDGKDVDGGEIQDLAVEHGLLIETKYDPEKHGPNNYDLEPGDPYLIFTDEFKAALAAT